MVLTAPSPTPTPHHRSPIPRQFLKTRSSPLSRVQSGSTELAFVWTPWSTSTAAGLRCQQHGLLCTRMSGGAPVHPGEKKMTAP